MNATMMDQSVKHLFVYGTLRKECPQETPLNLSDHCEFVGNGVVKGRLYMIADYPGLTIDGFSDKVSGELYEMDIPEITLPMMDKYEEFIHGDLEASEYIRNLTDVYLEDGSKIKAWTYYYNKPVKEENRIKSGNFIDALNYMER